MIEAALEPVSKEDSSTDGTGFQKSEEFFNSTVGINQAVSIAKASKSQISRDSNSNTLPFTLDEKSQRRYKVADLFQKYGFREQQETGSKSSKEHGSRPKKEPLSDANELFQTTQGDIERAILQTELKAKEDIIRRLEEEVRDLRQNRDRLIDQNQRLTMLLPAPKTETVQPALPDKKSFWQRLFS